MAGYRPMPGDFPETFARVGWEGILDEMHARRSTVLRWCHEFGYDELKAMRREYLERIYAEQGRRIAGRRPRTASGRYIMGLRRTPRERKAGGGMSQKDGGGDQAALPEPYLSAKDSAD